MKRDLEAEMNSVEWKSAGVWEDHLLPARNCLITTAPPDLEGAKQELREALDKLEKIDETISMEETSE